MTAARTALLDSYPQLDPLAIGTDRCRDRRAEAFYDRASDETYSVVSLEIDGALVVETISTFAHIPYGTPLVAGAPPHTSAIGVFVSAEPIHSPDARRARFAQRGAVHDAEVSAGHAVVFTWDTAWLRREDQPKPIALQIAGVWRATVAPVVAATPEEFGAEYARWCDTRGTPEQGDDDWAVGSFFDTSDFDEKLAMIEAVLVTPNLSGHAAGCLAAGPIEDLLGHRFLDYVMSDGARRARFIPLLEGCYWHHEPEEIQARMRAILGRG